MYLEERERERGFAVEVSTNLACQYQSVVPALLCIRPHNHTSPPSYQSFLFPSDSRAHMFHILFPINPLPLTRVSSPAFFFSQLSLYGPSLTKCISTKPQQTSHPIHERDHQPKYPFLMAVHAFRYVPNLHNPITKITLGAHKPKNTFQVLPWGLHIFSALICYCFIGFSHADNHEKEVDCFSRDTFHLVLVIDVLLLYSRGKGIGNVYSSSSLFTYLFITAYF